MTHKYNFSENYQYIIYESCSPFPAFIIASFKVIILNFKRVKQLM